MARLILVTAVVASLTFAGCGGGGTPATTAPADQANASEHQRSAHWEILPGARKRAAEQRDLVRATFDQARQVQRCISEFGFPTAAHISRNGPDSLGVVPVTRKDSGRRLPVAGTGLRTEHGYYYVGIAPTREIAQKYYVLQSGFPGGVVRDRARDGLVSLETVPFGRGRATYAANLRRVASCAFSVPAAPGQPKWEFSGPDRRPIIRSVESH